MLAKHISQVQLASLRQPGKEELVSRVSDLSSSVVEYTEDSGVEVTAFMA